MEKVIRLGIVRPERTEHGYNVYAKIQVKNGRLSISGVEGPLPGGHCRGSCGQIDMSINADSFAKLGKGWTKTLLEGFFKVWKDWHLNDLTAGCEHQQIMGWKYEDHPSEACPVCGYKCGTAWKTRPLPKAVIEFLEILPETDKTPSWV